MVGMRNFQDTYETRKRSFISPFFNLHDCTFNKLATIFSFNAFLKKEWLKVYFE